MKRVVIESPFAGRSNGAPWPINIIVKWLDRRQNIRYLRACIRNSLNRGEAPFASHAIYTQPGVLDDSNSNERNHGIQAGFEWAAVASLRAVYTDRGESFGMKLGVDNAKKYGQPIEYRSLPSWRRAKMPTL